MFRSLKLVALLALVCLCAQCAQAVPLPPPVVSELGTTQITATARLYEGVTFSGSPHGSATQQDCMHFYAGNFYVAYYNQDFRLCLARKNILAETWKTITFTDANALVPRTADPAEADTHDTPNIGISSDGRMHLAYGMHGDSLRHPTLLAPLSGRNHVVDADEAWRCQRTVHGGRAPEAGH